MKLFSSQFYEENGDNFRTPGTQERLLMSHSGSSIEGGDKTQPGNCINLARIKIQFQQMLNHRFKIRRIESTAVEEGSKSCVKLLVRNQGGNFGLEGKERRASAKPTTKDCYDK